MPDIFETFQTILVCIGALAVLCVAALVLLTLIGAVEVEVSVETKEDNTDAH